MPHKSDRRLYVDANDQVVEAKDPTRVKLLVGKGGEIPMEDARRYGLLQEAAENAAPEAARGQETARQAPEPQGPPEKPGTPPEAASEGAARSRAGQKSRA